MDPGAGPSGSGRGGNGAEDGGARGTRTWTVPAPGWGLRGPAPPRRLRSPAPLRRGPPAPCAPGRRGERALGGHARGPGGAEEKDERRADPCPPRVLRAACRPGPALRERRFWSRIPVVVSVKASHLLPTAPSHRQRKFMKIGHHLHCKEFLKLLLERTCSKMDSLLTLWKYKEAEVFICGSSFRTTHHLFL
ncbi:myosin IC heavy chain-like [Moschus berezovskii]|uniref:myosin IC heavy chain-like n=1 Tax=Moschus berezovskii TaxID=68408 RepID=UPI002445332F|nr:myosin IC heavy chain-like [Moschus berezovskii]